MNDRANDLRVWTHAPLSAAVRDSLERLLRDPDVAVVAAMPDVHLADEVCVGAVVATHTRLRPGAVGGDIGCGMAALRIEAGAALLDDARSAAQVLLSCGRAAPINRHRARDAVLPPELAEWPLSTGALERKKMAVGRVQFGTLGRGNHFVEIQRDPAGDLWLMLHSGSRGIGQAIRDIHTAAARDADFAAGSPAARAYSSDHDWALAYARLSRRAMVERITNELGTLLGIEPEWSTYTDCHHNFVRREQHGDRALWVHRKGAISARAGEPGIIPGSMGSASFHVLGRGCAAALCSSSHGAGRLASRTEARRRISTAALVQQMDGVWFDHRLADRLRDEAPAAYKDIGAVMRAQRELTRIVRRLEPVLVYKGG